jgi:hypothetical protein
MKIANSISRESDIQTKTASGSSKNTRIRKRIKGEHLEAINNVFNNYGGFKLTEVAFRVRGSNLPNVILERWATINNGTHEYYNIAYNDLKSINKTQNSKTFDLMEDFSDFYSGIKRTHAISNYQYSTATNAVNLLVQKKFSEQIAFKFSVENEILIIKHNSRGNHYLIIGGEENDISYGFVGNNIGEYATIHPDFENILIEDLVLSFINA